MEGIQFFLTNEQIEMLCQHYNYAPINLEDWEICELLDRFIDENC